MKVILGPVAGVKGLESRGVGESGKVRSGLAAGRRWLGGQVAATRPGRGEPPREVGWITVDWGEVESRRGASDLDEVAQDLVDLEGVGDGGENPHAVCTARTDPGVGAVDLCAEAGPGGGGAPRRDRPGAILAVRRRWPGEGRQAQEVGRAFPGSAGAG